MACSPYWRKKLDWNSWLSNPRISLLNMVIEQNRDVMRTFPTVGFVGFASLFAVQPHVRLCIVFVVCFFCFVFNMEDGLGRCFVGFLVCCLLLANSTFVWMAYLQFPGSRLVIKCFCFSKKKNQLSPTQNLKDAFGAHTRWEGTEQKKLVLCLV